LKWGAISRRCLIPSGEWAVGQKAAVPLERYGRVDEVTALLAFVAGPESSYIKGANPAVDGGTNA
jgi:3-oxoacyl-[acyl-carrier protein] reductase